MVGGRVLLVWSRLKHSRQLYVYRELKVNNKETAPSTDQCLPSHETKAEQTCAELGPGIAER